MGWEHRENHRASSLFRTGARVSVVQSVLFLVIASSALLLGIDQFVSNSFESLYVASPGLFLVFCGAFVLIAVLGLAITPAEKILIERADAGAAAWGSSLAYFGHMATIAFFSWWIFFAAMGAGSMEHAIPASVLMPLRWGLAFELIFVGAWVWIIAFILFRHRMLPRGFLVVSVCKAVSFWGAFAAFAASNKLLLLISVGLAAAVFGPVWHLWIAAIFKREAAHECTHRTDAVLPREACDAAS